MIEVRGDIWDYPADALCITTNGFVKSNGYAVMGRGTALQAKQRFPDIERALGRQIIANGNITQVLAYSLRGAVISLPVKHNWWEDADPELIQTSLTALADMAEEQKWVTVTLPRPGCGNGGLRWEDVKPMVEEILAHPRFVVVDRA